MNGFRSNTTGRLAAAGLAALGAALITAGCGGSSSTGATKGATKQSPAASVRRAAYVSTAASGFKLAMTMNETVSGSSAGQKTVSMTANGSFSPASHLGAMTMNMQIPAASGTQNLALQMVLDHSTIYMKLPATFTSRLPGGKPWISVNLAKMGKAAGMSSLGALFNSSSSMYNPGQYLDYLRAATSGSVKDLGQETVNGVKTTHYQATVSFSKLASAVPAGDRKAVQQLIAQVEKKASVTSIPVDAWIDSSHLIRRMRMTYTMSLQGHSVAVDISENISDYGPQPAPTVPGPNETTDLLSLMHGG